MSGEVEALLRKAEKYLRSAESLRAQGDFDSAVSRLYYVMFYCAGALLLSKGLTFSRHRAVHGAFSQHFMKTGELPTEMHRHFLEAFDKRQLSDYEAPSSLDSGDAQDLQDKAQRFLERTRGFLRQTGGQ